MSSASEESVETRMEKVAEKLQIPSNTLQITQVRMNQLSNESDVDEANLDDVAAAALAFSSREDGLPVSENNIQQAWNSLLESDEIEISLQHLEAVGSYLNIDEVPPHPDELVDEIGERIDMPEELVSIAHRLLYESYDANPAVVASGPSPAATAGAVLSLAALVNGEEDTYGQEKIHEASDVKKVTIRNRRRKLKGLLGEERLQDDRYRAGSDEETSETSASGSEEPELTEEADDESSLTEEADEEPSLTEEADDEPSTTEQAEAGSESDGLSTSELAETVRSMYPDELPTTTSLAEAHDESEEAVEAGLDELVADGTLEQKRAESVVVWIPTDGEGVKEDLTVSTVEAEIDALVDDLDLDPSSRLLAKGMVSDAVKDVDVEDAAELAAAVVVAASRVDGEGLDPNEVAAHREFETRVIPQWLDTLQERVDVDIPRKSADEFVDKLVNELGLSQAVREESLRSIERFNPDEVEGGYTGAELGSGALMFAATISPTDIDIGDISRITGAGPDYIRNAMNSIVVSLCLGLVRGDIDYDECAWTTGLLESAFTPDLGDSYTGRVIAVAKTYAAGRENEHIDDPTLEFLLGEE